MRIFNFLFLDRNRETGERFARIDGGAEKTYQLRRMVDGEGVEGRAKKKRFRGRILESA